MTVFIKCTDTKENAVCGRTVGSYLYATTFTINKNACTINRDMTIQTANLTVHIQRWKSIVT